MRVESAATLCYDAGIFVARLKCLLGKAQRSCNFELSLGQNESIPCITSRSSFRLENSRVVHSGQHIICSAAYPPALFSLHCVRISRLVPPHSHRRCRNPIRCPCHRAQLPIIETRAWSHQVFCICVRAAANLTSFNPAYLPCRIYNTSSSSITVVFKAHCRNPIMRRLRPAASRSFGRKPE